MSPKTLHTWLQVFLVLSLVLGGLAWARPAYAWPLPPAERHLRDDPDVGRAAPPAPPGPTPLHITTEGGDDSSGSNRTNGSGLDAGDPVSANNGAYHFDMPLLALGGPMNLGFTLRYRSDFNQVLWAEALPIRFWWSPWEDLEWERSPGFTFVTVQIANGDVISFKWVTDHWEPGAPFMPGVYPVPWSLQETGDYFYLMDPIGEQVHIFKKINQVGRIERIVDRNGNQLIYAYATDDTLFPSRVEDGLGRSLDFTYQKFGNFTGLVRVTDHAGRHVDFTYEEHGADNENVWTLRSITDSMGQTTTFHYTWKERDDHLVKWHHQITAVERPAGNTPYTQAYEMRNLAGSNASRVISQTDAYSHTTTLTYDPTAVKVTETRPDAATQVYEHYGRHSPPKSLTDPTGKTMHFSHDATTDRLTGVTDRLGDASQITYHPQTGKIASWTDAEGKTTTYTYTAQTQTFTNPLATTETVAFTFYDLTRVDHPDGSRETFTYDAHGNVLTRTDGLGNVWHYTYNGRGQLLTATNPEGGVTTYTYNADGTLASRTDSDTGVTTYDYDAYKRLSVITRPGGATVNFTYDLNDRLLTRTDELGDVTTFTYDANGNRDTATNPLGQTVTYAQDLMDRLSGVTDPLGQSSHRTYDEMGRLASFTDRNGNTTAYAYAPRGWCTGITDPAGHTWTTGYDDEGVPTAFTTPLGRTTAFQTDNLGRTTVITDPLGAATAFTYDAMGRLTSTADRMGRATTYAYDDAGRLVGVTRAGLGSATYTRNDLGLLSRITDPQGKHWDFGYSAMGRLTSHTDPLGRRWAYAYDNRGRLSQITYPDSTTTAYTYDAASRVTQIAYFGGPTLDYTYDDAGRLLTADGIAFTRDARGDITDSRDGSASFGATYDKGRRVKTVTYDGQATVTYTYDGRNLLTRVEDDLSGAWMTFAYDDDGRLTEIARSNGVSTTLAYDDAGRVTRIQDGGANGGSPLQADQRYTLNAEGEPTHVARTLPLNPPPALPSLNLTYDDANQISASGYAYDARGRQTAAPGKTFAYDGASRLTSVSADGSTAAFTYNGLGDLRTRTVDGITTHYYHNYALGLNPIVAEKTGAAYDRFYVYTPGGALLYSIEPGSGAVRFYHFDRLGSTLFLTDGAGAVSDAYAYDPYGNLLGHTGTSDQPFTYVGRYGVRYEPVGALYDMRARVYDPATARFLTRDPVWPALRDLRSLNPYAYAAQSPLYYIDPLGMKLQRIRVRIFLYWRGSPWKLFRLLYQLFQFAAGPGDATSVSLSGGGGGVIQPWEAGAAGAQFTVGPEDVISMILSGGGGGVIQPWEAGAAGAQFTVGPEDVIPPP